MDYAEILILVSTLAAKMEGESCSQGRSLPACGGKTSPAPSSRGELWLHLGMGHDFGKPKESVGSIE